MKKTILSVLVFLVLTITSYSQNRLGFTYEEVKKEFNYERYDMSEKTFKKKSYIQITQGSTITLFTFNKKTQICNEVSMEPTSNQHLMDYIDLFDERFDQVKHHKWYGTEKERNFQIVLNEGDQFIFTPRK